MCLKTWQGFSRDYLTLGLERGAGPCFLHEVWQREKVHNEEEQIATSEPAKLAIGVEGGFKSADQQFEIVKEHWIVVLDSDAKEMLRFRCVINSFLHLSPHNFSKKCLTISLFCNNIYIFFVTDIQRQTSLHLYIRLSMP